MAMQARDTGGRQVYLLALRALKNRAGRGEGLRERRRCTGGGRVRSQHTTTQNIKERKETSTARLKTETKWTK